MSHEPDDLVGAALRPITSLNQALDDQLSARRPTRACCERPLCSTRCEFIASPSWRDCLGGQGYPPCSIENPLVRGSRMGGPGREGRSRELWLPPVARVAPLRANGPQSAQGHPAEYSPRIARRKRVRLRRPGVASRGCRQGRSPGRGGAPTHMRTPPQPRADTRTPSRRKEGSRPRFWVASRPRDRTRSARSSPGRHANSNRTPGNTRPLFPCVASNAACARPARPRSRQRHPRDYEGFCGWWPLARCARCLNCSPSV